MKWGAQMPGEAQPNSVTENTASPLDLERKTIIVDDHEPVPLVGDPSINPIVFGLPPQATFGVRSGTLNRVTGTATVHIIKDGLQLLNGICKPARKVL